jgi:pimeloyl-ACP methyl ester carboxylesterase
LSKSDPSTITTKDGTEIYFKDWGKGPVVTFSHGWPLSSDAWDGQMFFLAQNGFRVVAHDRRGHGRSSQTYLGNDMDGYDDDLATVIEALDLREATLVGHSTGGGEVARYIGRYGTKRVAKTVLIAAVPPIMLKSATNPEGLPMEVFDDLRSSITKDCSQFYKDLAISFYGANRQGPRSPRESWISSGSGACRLASRTPTKASKPSLRLISPRTSRSSMSQPWSCMVRTTRSFQSRIRLRNRLSSSRARRKSTILAHLTASRPRTRISSTPTCCPS